MATLTDVHRLLIREKLLDGIEVVNDQTFSIEALQIALDNNLTIMGNSDIHKLVDWDYKVPEGGHRPITLVFAKERTAEIVRLIYHKLSNNQDATILLFFSSIAHLVLYRQ